MGIVEIRKEFSVTSASRLAQQVSPSVRRFVAGSPLSTMCNFFADRQTLVLVVGDHEKPVDVDKALAYGLAWSGDRDLAVVLPAGKADPTLRRAAFIDAPVRVFTHGIAWCEHPIPAVHTVIDVFTDPLVESICDLGAHASWIAELAAWADGHSDLRASHRPSYLAWHCLGRMVLKVARSKSGLRVSAGVHSTLAVSSYSPLVRFDLEGLLTRDEFDAVREAASSVIADRVSGRDTGHWEHFLQARLGDHFDLLGLQRVEREFPCVRPGGDRAYIDLLGVDANGDLHIVETKIGDDVMLIMQGLDYYAWACAHVSDLAKYLQLTKRPQIFLDFVVSAPAKGGPAIGPYTASQAEVIDGSIRWRFMTVTGWHDPSVTPQVDKLPRRTVPDGAAAALSKVVPRCRDRLTNHLALHLHGKLSHNGVTVTSLDDHLLPDARPAWDALDAQHKLHKWARHMRSSQAFALNLFAPLPEQAVADLLATVFGSMRSAQRAVFEYEDELDELHESQSKRPHRTQIDVVLRGVTSAGRPVVLALEVKLTESDFGRCSAATSIANDTPHVCTQDGPWGSQPDLCFQLRNHGGPVRRRYDQHVRPPEYAPDKTAPGCWYRTSGSQPMRNVALGDVIRRREHADVRFGLCAPGNNDVIWRRWSDARRVLPDEATLDFPAEHVLAHHRPDQVDWLRGRYLLGEPIRHDLAGNVEWLTWKIIASLTARQVQRGQVIETHPGGGQYDCIALHPHAAEALLPHVELNRVGSAHVFWPDGGHDIARDVWERGARHGPLVAADDVAALAGMGAQTQPSTPFWEHLADQAAAEILNHRNSHWRNGVSDDEWEGDGIRRRLFESCGIPIHPLGDEPNRAHPSAESHWFLLRDDQLIGHAQTAP